MQNEQANWFQNRKTFFPLELANATALTRTGTPDAKRHGGPGTASKNPERYARIGKERAERANA